MINHEAAVRVARPHLRVVSPDKVDDDSELGQFIPLHYHFQMLADRSRMAPFEAAIAHAVRPGARVLELGAGTGVLSYFAARSGAARVWSVERLPHLAKAARGFLARNGVADRVEVVNADAFEYLPPEPVDVVICEMLHTAMLREKQSQVIAQFKRRYAARFGAKMPRFVPEATVLAVQAVQQAYEFHGYHAEVPMFLPDAAAQGTVGLAPHAIYGSWFYDDAIPMRFEHDAVIVAETRGELNALRFATRNLVAVLPREGRSIDWDMHHLVMPLPRALTVAPGDRVRVRFHYDAGDSLLALADSLDVSRV